MSGIDMYFTDKVNIIQTSYDSFGAVTENTVSDVSCRFHPSNKLIMNKDGKEVQAQARLFLPYDTTLEYNYKIQLVSINGEELSRKDKKYPIQSIRRSHGFTNSHL